MTESEKPKTVEEFVSYLPDNVETHWGDDVYIDVKKLVQYIRGLPQGFAVAVESHFEALSASLEETSQDERILLCLSLDRHWEETDISCKLVKKRPETAEEKRIREETKKTLEATKEEAERLKYLELKRKYDS